MCLLFRLFCANTRQVLSIKVYFYQPHIISHILIYESKSSPFFSAQ